MQRFPMLGRQLISSSRRLLIARASFASEANAPQTSDFSEVLEEDKALGESELQAEEPYQPVQRKRRSTDINLVLLRGRVATRPAIIETKTVPMAIFSLAMNEEGRDEASFVSVRTFMPSVVRAVEEGRLPKGLSLEVQGRLGMYRDDEGRTRMQLRADMITQVMRF